ncbi:MAG: YkvA family protein [Lagierella massiliensis]|nr:YkvA family protein [Lagierella massiliensis]
MNPKKILDGLMGKSNKVLNNKYRFFRLLTRTIKKSDNIGQFSDIKSDLGTIFNLTNDFLKGKYKKVSKTSLLLIIGSFIYLLNPMDVVPDFILGLGFLDDLAVFTYLIKKIRKELDKYNDWKNISNE